MLEAQRVNTSLSAGSTVPVSYQKRQLLVVIVTIRNHGHFLTGLGASGTPVISHFTFTTLGALTPLLRVSLPSSSAAALALLSENPAFFPCFLELFLFFFKSIVLVTKPHSRDPSPALSKSAACAGFTSWPSPWERRVQWNLSCWQHVSSPGFQPQRLSFRL